MLPRVKLRCFPNHHTSERVMIGEAEPSGQFKIPPGQRHGHPRRFPGISLCLKPRATPVIGPRIVLMPASSGCDKPGSFNDSVEPIVEPAVEAISGVNLISSYVTDSVNHLNWIRRRWGKLSFLHHFSLHR